MIFIYINCVCFVFYCKLSFNSKLLACKIWIYIIISLFKFVALLCFEHYSIFASSTYWFLNEPLKKIVIVVTFGQEILPELSWNIYNLFSLFNFKHKKLFSKLNLLKPKFNVKNSVHWSYKHEHLYFTILCVHFWFELFVSIHRILICFTFYLFTLLCPFRIINKFKEFIYSSSILNFIP